MGDAYDPGNTDLVCRLFPLPQVVLLPHAVLPLHIFEPRYRQMTEDALESGDNLIAMVLLRESESPKGIGSPQVEEVACLGKIVQHRRLPDGRFNLLLLGLKRIRLVREVASKELYRVATAESFDDLEEQESATEKGAELLKQFRLFAERHQEHDADLHNALGSGLPLGVLTDMIAQAMDLSAPLKQSLLAERSPEQRAAFLLEILAKFESDAPAPARRKRTFPPPFSNN